MLREFSPGNKLGLGCGFGRGGVPSIMPKSFYAARRRSRTCPRCRSVNSNHNRLYNSLVSISLFSGLYPPHFFFSFLYYTDVGSVFFILLTVLLSTPRASSRNESFGRLCLASICGAVSILMRQTNAVWVMFAFGIACLQDLEAGAWRVRLTSDGLFGQLQAFASGLIVEAPTLLARRGLLLLPALAFACFVFGFNGGHITVGDHDNHTAAAHWAQICYLSVFTAVPLAVDASFAVALQPGRSAVSNLVHCLRAETTRIWTRERTHFLWWIAALAVFVQICRNYTLAHPFILADNRHYTFYVWRRVLGPCPPYTAQA